MVRSNAFAIQRQLLTRRVCGGAGGHLNPAVTFVNCLYRGFPWWKFPIYAVAQVMGCFCGAAIIYGNYKSAIDVYEGGAGIRTVPGYSDTATAGVFNTYPQPFLTKTGQVFSEIIASTVLIFVIFALKDDANLGAQNLTPLMLFFLIFGIGATLGWETGYGMLPFVTSLRGPLSPLVIPRHPFSKNL
jgi:aquaglyceroporin related protein, other eukaryote